MRGGRRNYYNSYKGRKSPREKKLMVFAILLFILLLAAVGLYVLSECVVFTPDGFYFTFQQPQEPSPPTVNDPSDEDGNEDFNIVIEPPVSDGASSVELPRILGVRDDIDNLLRSGYASGLATAAIERGCNTLAFDVKDTDGVLNIPITSSYSSQGSQAENASQLKEVLTSLKEEAGVYLAARVTALSDNLAPRAFMQGAITTSGTTWLDRNMNSWIDPYSTMAAEYLSDIVMACAASGFDMVIFEDFCFPTEGRLELMEFSFEDSEAARFEAIRTLLANVKEPADAEGIAIGIVLESLETENATSGQRAADLAQYCHTIFYEGQSQTAFNEALRAAVADTSCGVGVINNGAYATPEEGFALIAGYLQ